MKTLVITLKKMRYETYKAENIDEIVWLRLNRLKSIKLCENLIKDKLLKSPNPLITEDILRSKAIGLSSTIESAIGYWQVNPQAVNAKVLSRYYFLLQMTIAEQVSSVKNTDDLKVVQRHTENGHGLGTIMEPNLDFPDNYFTFALRNGHFYSYTRSLAIDTKKYDFEKRPRKFSEINDVKKIVNLIDLFRRIPELRNIIEEYTNKPPLSFHVGYSLIDNHQDINSVEEIFGRSGQFALTSPSKSKEKTSYIDIYSESEQVNPEYLSTLVLPLTDFQIKIDSNSNERYITGKLIHPSDENWHQNIKTYSSSYAPTSYVVPLWDATNDNIVINFTLLYTLSIIVRYLPDLWYRINSGDLNHIGSLIEYYVSIIDHVLPLEMLERITDAQISIHQPGSLFGQI
jgi:hypothetical protein